MLSLTSWHIFSMIEMMEDYTSILEERLKKRNHINVRLVQDDTAVNSEPAYSSSFAGLADFTNCRMAVMMMLCVDSATAESGNDCNFVDVVRESAASLVGEVIVVKEAWNSIIVAVGPSALQLTGTPVTQLLALARQVIIKVYDTDNSLEFAI